MAGKWLVDFDGTLVRYDKWVSCEHIGEPIQPMIDRVKMWLKQGRDVQIFTARAYPIGIDMVLTGMSKQAYDTRIIEASRAVKAIQDWSVQKFGRALPVVCWKDYHAVEVWDDRAVQLIPNEGLRVDGHGRPGEFVSCNEFDKGYSAGYTSGYAEALDKYGIKQ